MAGFELKPYSKNPIVHVDPKGMFANMKIPAPSADEKKPDFSVADLELALTRAGVSYGIDSGMVNALAESPMYDTDVIVAVGKPPVEGENGYYEYFFSQDFTKKPKIRPDGSADFLSIKLIEVVHEGDLLATYHPAVFGENGISVRGAEIKAKMVRDLQPLAGKGFHRDDNDVDYYADMDGKIILTNNRINISPIYEIDQDADMTVGNIEFKGDVIIHGGVKHGVTINASGTVTIDGLVENCHISAGKNLFLLSGVKGGEKTFLHSDGGITAEFIEYAHVTCKDDLRADVLFNCIVECDGRVVATAGKHSAIIGGSINAVEGVSTLVLGNKFGTVTKVTVGIDDERMKEMASVLDKIRNLEDNIAKIKKGIDDFDKIASERNPDYKNDPRRMQLLRVKIRDEAVVSKDRIRLEELQELVERGRRATVKVYDTVYAGISVRKNESMVTMSDYQKHVEFVKTETGIRLEVLEEPIPEE
ncbi:MAG: FapA family protein [Lachnospiraceae bacterium]|nr:FapA family protein [Lachnospiraceae bacterium]